MSAQSLYPRTVTISRQPGLGIGNVGFRGPEQANEVTVLSGLRASIEFQTRGPNPLAKVPSDAVGRTLWRIFVAAGSVAVGSISRDDIATDDLTRRFKLNEPFWGDIDVQIEAELLRA